MHHSSWQSSYAAGCLLHCLSNDRCQSLKVSRRVHVRLTTMCVAVESVSTQKYPRRSSWNLAAAA